MERFVYGKGVTTDNGVDGGGDGVCAAMWSGVRCALYLYYYLYIIYLK